MRKTIDTLFYLVAIVIVMFVINNVMSNIQWMNRHCHTHYTKDAGE